MYIDVVKLTNESEVETSIAGYCLNTIMSWLRNVSWLLIVIYFIWASFGCQGDWQVGIHGYCQLKTSNLSQNIILLSPVILSCMLSFDRSSKFLFQQFTAILGFGITLEIASHFWLEGH